MSDNEQMTTGINYDLLVEDSLRNVTRGALAIAEHAGLPGEAHFYITFKTTHDGVEVNPELVKGEGDELTIVLQHQYWDLKVEERSFSGTLSFSAKPERLGIPHPAIPQSRDRSAGFSLQFDVQEGDSDEGDIMDDASSEAAEETSAEIVSLDSFRSRGKEDH